MTSVGVMASAVVSGVCTDVLREPFDNLATWVTAGTPTIVTGRTGNAAQLPAGSGTTIRYNIPSGAQSDTLTVGFALRLNSLQGAHTFLVLGSDSGATDHLTVLPGTDGSIGINRVGGAQLGSRAPVGTLVVGTYAYLELQAVLSDTVGSVTLRVNGTTVITTTAVDTKNAGTKTVFDQISFRSVGGGSAWQVDDLYLSAGAGCSFKGDQTVVNTSPVLLNDPCENLSAWVTVAGSPTITTGFTGNGFSIGSTEAIGYDIPSGRQTDSVTVGFRIKFSAIPASYLQFLAWRSDAGVTSHVQLRIYNPSGQLAFTRVSGNVNLGTPVFHGMVTGTWYYVEASLRLSDTVGQGILRKDGAELYRTGTTEDTKSGGTKTVFDQIRFNGGTGLAFIVDDIYIRNDLTFGP